MFDGLIAAQLVEAPLRERIQQGGLLENASSAFLDAVRKSMRSIWTAIGAATINPNLLTCAEKLQYEGYL